jgi:hypothetical protein
LSAAAADDFDALVEATRIGTVLAHDAKAARKWRRRPRRPGGQRRPEGLTGENLERVVMGLAVTNREYVVFGPRAG